MGFAPSSMQLTSTDFVDGGAIPAKYTGDDVDVSPALAWRDAPAGTTAFAIICHDPDAPLVTPDGTYGFVHWVLYNIPGNVHALTEATTEFTQGNNNFGKPGYNGPLPPKGHGAHHYYFWVLALSNNNPLPAGLSLWELLRHIEPALLGMNRLVATYQRN